MPAMWPASSSPSVLTCACEIVCDSLVLVAHGLKASFGLGSNCGLMPVTDGSPIPPNAIPGSARGPLGLLDADPGRGARRLPGGGRRAGAVGDPRTGGGGHLLPR